MSKKTQINVFGQSICNKVADTAAEAEVKQDPISASLLYGHASHIADRCSFNHPTGILHPPSLPLQISEHHQHLSSPIYPHRHFQDKTFGRAVKATPTMLINAHPRSLSVRVPYRIPSRHHQRTGLGQMSSSEFNSLSGNGAGGQTSQSMVSGITDCSDWDTSSLGGFFQEGYSVCDMKSGLLHWMGARS